MLLLCLLIGQGVGLDIKGVYLISTVGGIDSRYPHRPYWHIFYYFFGTGNEPLPLAGLTSFPSDCLSTQLWLRVFTHNATCALCLSWQESYCPEKEGCGVPQGDALSLVCICVCMWRNIRKLWTFLSFFVLWKCLFLALFLWCRRLLSHLQLYRTAWIFQKTHPYNTTQAPNVLHIPPIV